MAKNLKIKVKNTQFAEALKLNKKKTTEQEEPIKAKEDVASSQLKKAPVKATAEPTLMKRKAVSKPSLETSLPEKVVAQEEDNAFHAIDGVEQRQEAQVLEKIEEKAPIFSDQASSSSAITEEKFDEIKVESEEEKTKIGTVRPGTEKKIETEERKPKPVPKSLDELFEEEKAEALKKKKDKEVGAKAFVPKAPKKGFSNESSFDSRARQGLEGDDEGAWKRKRFRPKQHKAMEVAPIIRPTELSVKIPITIKDLAQAMKIKAADLIGKLFLQGLVVTINDYLDDETIVQLLGHDFGCAITIDTSEETRLNITDKTVREEIAEDIPSHLIHRAPVVAFMGHVDHGKTSLIDAIRKSNRVAQEAGAITQHIGAFRCKTTHGFLTILDTPGHEAFSSMRTRGSGVTDIVVLVIAGDEGIKPQTDEAIAHAQAAGAPIVVAINKCDKPSFNAEEVYRQLADRNLLPEVWGGSIITVNCSAVTKQGLTELLELVSLQSEILELKANPNKRARGAVLESELKKGLGITATLLIQNGSLKVGDALVIGHVYGKVKTIHDEHGKSLQEAEPSVPVKITGLSDLPKAGHEFIVVDNEKEAKALCFDRRAGHERELLKKSGRSLENLLEQNAEFLQRKELKIILKADVQGSLEAIKQSLKKIVSTKVDINIISSAVGEISESDVELASISNAIIIGFHTQVESHADSFIKQNGIKVKMFDVIYHLIDDVKKEMILLLDKIRQENHVATAEVRATFKASTLGVIAGCTVTDGIIKRNHFVKVFRGDEVIYQGNIASLKRVQDDVKEVAKGLECGIVLQNFGKIQVGDLIKAYEITYLTAEL
ncbi:MAG: translation initiation factor IF-2 [Chlamydiales bacterium]|nr:translation initiation factor IF-2 [Chlamydiales bacterium]